MKARRLDWAIGIVLGVVIGLAVVSAFVFLGSEGAIDSPRISGVDTGKPARTAPASETGPSSTVTTPTAPSSAAE